MRRSRAPSVKRQRLTGTEADENSQPCSQPPAVPSCSTGVTLNGFLAPSYPARNSGDVCKDYNFQQQAGSSSQIALPSSMPVFRQFKCPLPSGFHPSGSGSGSGKGTLGLKRRYACVGKDILAAIQRRIVVEDPSATTHNPASGIITDLVLYDPDEHKQQLQALQETQDAAAAAAGPAGATAPSTQLPNSLQEQQTQPQTGTQQASMPAIDWDKRVRVHADHFLVQKLRPHQREGVRFVFECLSGVRQEGVFGAVLADGMGLGKTFQTIASLYSLLTKGVTGSPTCCKPLILCPTSLVQNWGKELKHWLGDRVAPVAVDDTRADRVKRSFQEFRSFSHGGKPKVLVMSYPCFRMHKAEVYRMGIDVVMCDEAHFLKNGEAQITQAVAGLSAKRRLLMSGTPIQNDLSEFHAVFDLACPGLLGDLKAFNKVYEGPIQKGRDADATEKQVAVGLERMSQLMRLCNKFMLRRTSTVLKALLPAKVEQVVFCKLSPLQLKLYNTFLASKPVKALLASTDTSNTGSGAAPRKRKSNKPTTAAQGVPGAAAEETATQQDQKATEAASGNAVTQQEQQKEDMLAPLAAITALKKLCCHPDLIYEMLNKAKVQQQQKLQQQQLSQMLQAQKRMSARACTSNTKNYAIIASGGGDDSDGNDTGSKAGNGRRRHSAPAADDCGTTGGAAKKSSSARQQLTGFEGCDKLFSSSDVYPVYQPGRCQAYHSGKVMVLEALLKAIRASEPTDKVVLVSNYTEALDVLGVMCSSHGWVSLRLDGSCSVKQRQTLVDTFNDPQHPSFVLLLSSKAGGVGLNIIGANRLVLFDPDWNPANDLQAMARVWREGQKKRVWIYRMLMAGSIEEKVLQRQLAKQGLSEALVDEVGQQVRTFSRDELRSLFRVNPHTPCETHQAIKCTCDGSVEAMASCKERSKAAATARGGGSSSEDGAAGDSSSGDDAGQGVLAWAHLARASDSPDPIWQAVLPFVRDKYVTYVFSDHALDEDSSGGEAGEAAGAASIAAAKGQLGKQHAKGEMQSDESEQGANEQHIDSSDDDDDQEGGADTSSADDSRGVKVQQRCSGQAPAAAASWAANAAGQTAAASRPRQLPNRPGATVKRLNSQPGKRGSAAAAQAAASAAQQPSEAAGAATAAAAEEPDEDALSEQLLLMHADNGSCDVDDWCQ